EVVARCFRADDRAIELQHVRRACVIAGQIIRGPAADRPPWDQFQLPCDLFLWPTRRSYTRQPLAEVHTFGSPPLLDAVLRALCDAGARLARPGEFTLRAFLAGRIDLMQAEAVLGVIDAADRRQLQSALEQLAGGLSRPLNGLRNDLLDLLADLEAGLDFVEEDIRFVSPEELAARLKSALDLLEQSSCQLAARGTGDGLARVALAGAPNAGKSSLFNALVGNSAAIVSAHPGTTRDYLVAKIDADGLPIELVDTAGVDTTCSERLPWRSEISSDQHRPSGSAETSAETSIAASAQARARQQREQAGLRLLCVDATGGTFSKLRDDT